MQKLTPRPEGAEGAPPRVESTRCEISAEMWLSHGPGGGRFDGTGMPINFNEPVLKRGLKRLADNAPDAPPARPSASPAPSAHSGSDFLKSLRLCVSAVNQ